MKKYILIALISLLFVNCSNSNKEIFSKDTVLITEFPCQKTLQAELFLEEYGIADLVCLKDYLLYTTIEGKENLFYIYNYDGDSIAAFGQRGQGPNELLNCVYNGQSFEDDTCSIVWISDVSNMRLCAVDIHKSLQEGACFFRNIIKTYRFAVNIFCCNDSLLILEERTGDNYNIVKMNPESTNILSETPLYEIPVIDPFSHYKSFWRLKPDGKKIVSVMQSVNQVNVLDVNTLERKSLKMFSKYPYLDDIIDPKTEIEKQTYYCDVEVTDDYIYALFMDQPSMDSYEKEKSQEIHVFTWQGDPVCQLNIPQYITDISIDKHRGYIYGWDQINEKVYKYKIDM